MVTVMVLAVLAMVTDCVSSVGDGDVVVVMTMIMMVVIVIVIVMAMMILKAILCTMKVDIVIYTVIVTIMCNAVKDSDTDRVMVIVTYK